MKDSRGIESGGCKECEDDCLFFEPEPETSKCLYCGCPAAKHRKLGWHCLCCYTISPINIVFNLIYKNIYIQKI